VHEIVEAASARFYLKDRLDRAARNQRAATPQLLEKAQRTVRELLADISPRAYG